MSEKIKYQVLALDRRNEGTKWIFEKIDEQLDILERAYKMEMSLMNDEPEKTFEFDSIQICVAFTESFELLGFVSFGCNKEYITIEHAYVHPSYRNKGIYSTMLKRLKKLTEDIGYNKICSFIFKTNKGSIKAHKSLGFKEKLKGYVLDVK